MKSLNIIAGIIGKTENNAPKKSEAVIRRELQIVVDDCKAALSDLEVGASTTPARTNLRGGDSFSARAMGILSQAAVIKAGRYERNAPAVKKAKNAPADTLTGDNAPADAAATPADGVTV